MQIDQIGIRIDRKKEQNKFVNRKKEKKKKTVVTIGFCLCEKKTYREEVL